MCGSIDPCVEAVLPDPDASQTTEVIMTNKEAETDPSLEWRPIETCPTGPKVLLLNQAGIANTGWYDGKDSWFVAWFPLPKIPPAIRKRIEHALPSNIGQMIAD